MNAYKNRVQQEYNIAKFIGYFSIRPHLDKANSHRSIDELIPMPWDKKHKPKVEPITLDEFNLMREKFKI